MSGTRLTPKPVKGIEFSSYAREAILGPSTLLTIAFYAALSLSWVFMASLGCSLKFRTGVPNCVKHGYDLSG